MRVKFMIDGESPQIGKFRCGEDREISEDIGKIFCARGLAEEIKSTTAKAIKKEDKDNGGD